MTDVLLSNTKEKLLEIMIEVEDVVVELKDRADGDFDDMIVNQLSGALKQIESLWGELKNETKV